MTRSVASPSILPSKPPSTLPSGIRRSALPVLCGIALSSCAGDIGDLFPEPPPASAELQPASADAPPSSAELPGSVAPEGIGVSGGSETESELPLAPAARDDAAAENGANGANAEPTPVVPGGPPDPASPNGVPVGEPGAEPRARVCASMQSPLLLDFEVMTGDAAQALFGDFEAVLSGGTYVYPPAAPAAPGGPGAQRVAARGLASDVTAGDWRISGSVLEQSGFGLFLDCQLLDASRFAGISFRIAGSVGTADTVTLLVGTASNEVSPTWRIENGAAGEPSSGRCTPALDEYDGTCNQARIDIEVSAESREVFVPFAALSGGRPEPGVNPAELTTLGWALPAPVVTPLGNAVPYAVNLRIDDIRFVEAPPPR